VTGLHDAFQKNKPRFVPNNIGAVFVDYKEASMPRCQAVSNVDYKSNNTKAVFPHYFHGSLDVGMTGTVE
jgi:hypothetical protein